MRQSIDYRAEFLDSVQESLEYAQMTDEQITDAITELEGSNWDDSTDQYQRV